MEKYFNNDIRFPKYLFHGSPKLLDVIEQRQSHDSNGVIENEDYAVFLTSSFIIASAYAFKDKIKELSVDLEWNFTIGYDHSNNKENIIFENVNLDDELEGYIYVFSYSDAFDHKDNSVQYKCYESIKPIKVIKIRIKDFKKYYTIINTCDNKTKEI